MHDGTAIDTIRADFIEKVGLITQAEGLPRIAGRVLGLLIFDGAAVSFGDLAVGLQVSRASISSSIRLLEERGLIKRVAKPGDRQDYLQLASNPYESLLEGLRKRTQSAQNEIAETIAALPPENDAIDRLRAYATFYASTDAAIAAAITELKTQDNIHHGSGPMALKDKTHDSQ